MTLVGLLVRIIAIGLTLYFLISEVIAPKGDADFSIWLLKAVLLFIALPALYLFKLLAYFNVSIPWPSRSGGAYWLSGEHGLLQAKLFYWAVYIIIFTLIIIELIE